VLLDRLKHDPATRHVPVHVVSGFDEERRCLQNGALGFSRKPVTAEDLLAHLAAVKEFVEKRQKHLLVIEDDPLQRQAIADMIGDGDVETTRRRQRGERAAGTRAAGVRLRRHGSPASEMSGFELLERIRPTRGIAACR